MTEETKSLSRTTEVTLYGLEEELLALLDTEDMVTDPVERAAIERQIIATRLAVVEKRDRVAGLLRHCKRTQEAIAEERKRLTDLAKHYEAVEQRVKGYVAEVIRASGKDAKGKYRTLEGRLSVMRLQGAGGVQALELTDGGNFVPDQFFNAEITMPYLDWLSMIGCCEIECQLPDITRTMSRRVINTEALRAALAEKCDVCLGNKQIIDLNLAPYWIECSKCGGDGLRHIPGARLLPRGEVVVVK